jgi:hypothetical protein
MKFTTDTETPPRKPPTEVPKPVTDRLTREPAEHPARIPQDSVPHPVTDRRPTVKRERVGVD